MRKPIRRSSTRNEKTKHTEQVIPATIAISCQFRLFRFRYGLALANDFSERSAPEPSRFVAHPFFSSRFCHVTASGPRRAWVTLRNENPASTVRKRLRIAGGATGLALSKRSMHDE